MWYKRLFKPIKKIGEHQSTIGVPELVVVVTLADRLQIFTEQVDIDLLVENPVIRRFLLTLHWGDVTQLFDAILYNKKEAPSLTAVNIYSYFKPAGTLASVCLKRLCTSLKETPSIPYFASVDIECLISQLEKASIIRTENP